MQCGGFREQKKFRWHAAAEITASLGGLGAHIDRLNALSGVWDREIGPRGAHWQLSHVESGTIFVKVSGGAAAQELKMRSSTICRMLNKHFKRPWIKDIKPLIGK